MKYFDLHCDTAFECYIQNCDFYSNSLAVSGEKGGIFSLWEQVFAIWIKDDAENPFDLYKRIYKDFKEKLKNSPANLIPHFAIEGGAVIEDDKDRIYILKNDGIKLLTLCWNGENLIAGGSKTDKTLTRFGKEVIELMNKEKIGCDLSHLNKKSFYAALSHAEYPLATHSDCYGICKHKRNLSDEQIKALMESGGIMGICFYPEFLGENVFEKIYENIFYLCNKGYENSIAIGSDFDGGVMDKSLDGLCKIPLLYEFLANKGLKKDLLCKIFFENAHNFIAKL